MAKLRNWTINYANQFLGEVYDHPVERHYDGKEIVTSRVVKKLADNTYETRSGTIYELEGSISDNSYKTLKELDKELTA